MNVIINRKRCVNFTSYALMNLIMNCQNVTTTLFLPNMVLLSLAILISPYALLTCPLAAFETSAARHALGHRHTAYQLVSANYNQLHDHEYYWPWVTPYSLYRNSHVQWRPGTKTDYAGTKIVLENQTLYRYMYLSSTIDEEHSGAWKWCPVSTRHRQYVDEYIIS